MSVRDPAKVAQIDNMLHQLNRMFPNSKFEFSENLSTDMHTLFRKFPDGTFVTMATRPSLEMHAFV